MHVTTPNLLVTSKKKAAKNIRNKFNLKKNELTKTMSWSFYSGSTASKTVHR